MSQILIQAEELLPLLGKPGVLIFDVRHDLGDHGAGYKNYLAGHIPGALFLDHETQLSAARTGKNGRHPLPQREDFAVLMRTQGMTARTQVVVYDAANSCMAAHLWWMLRWLGHTNVMVLDGGLAAWQAAGAALESGPRSPALSEAQALQGLVLSGKSAMPTVDANAVVANLDSGVFTILDARGSARFSGASEPLDPVAGHISGALNRPFENNLTANNFFKPATVLQREFQDLLGARRSAAVVHQCGSGISACHNLFAMELAGLYGSALYPGSWSEWCSDPSRPVARGDA